MGQNVPVMKNNHNFISISEVSNKYGEKNDCVVKALSLVSGYSYEKVHNFLRLKGRKFRKGTLQSIWIPAMKALGIQHNFSRFSGKTTMNLRVPSRNSNYLILSASHVAAMIEGKVQDWSDGRRTRVLEVWEVTLGEPTQEFLDTPEEVVIEKTARKPRTTQVLWEMVLYTKDEDGEIIDGEVVNEYKRKPTKMIKDIKHIYLRGRPDTKGRLAIRATGVNSWEEYS